MQSKIWGIITSQRIIPLPRVTDSVAMAVVAIVALVKLDTFAWDAVLSPISEEISWTFARDVVPIFKQNS